jgi:hypothetical protein
LLRYWHWNRKPAYNYNCDCRYLFSIWDSLHWKYRILTARALILVSFDIDLLDLVWHIHRKLFLAVLFNYFNQTFIRRHRRGAIQGYSASIFSSLNKYFNLFHIYTVPFVYSKIEWRWHDIFDLFYIHQSKIDREIPQTRP